MKWLMYPVFHLYLKRKIKENYRLRENGELPDKWYWADELACNYGYFVEDLE